MMTSQFDTVGFDAIMMDIQGQCQARAAVMK
jgi:hypothetical protein